jgi:hypothetical protein
MELLRLKLKKIIKMVRYPRVLSVFISNLFLLVFDTRVALWNNLAFPLAYNPRNNRLTRELFKSILL